MRPYAVLLLLVAWPVAAQSVHKCADGRGGHSYQSQPCTEGETLRTWTADEVQDAPASAASQRTVQPPTQRRPATSSRARPARATTPRRDDQHARCVAARASRENSLRKLGSQRRYDDLRRLNERVSAVCNHRGRG
ncbi:hypothetical protein [Luteimonas sp. 9C]|uniref:hypothetical protein n=1 Tax=Luteimonas sp. 9C TaxID=2653148 RepID=UPI00135B79D6|nr:hypothetical protein [Luteimonas sp. 9C]